MSEHRIKYCALTTTSNSLQSFMLPFLYSLKKYDYEITLSCANDMNFEQMIKNDFEFFPLDISRGFHLLKTIKNIFTLFIFFKKEKFQMIEYGTENVALCAALAGWLAGVPIRIYDHWGARFIGFTGLYRLVSIWIERLAAFFSTDIRQVSEGNAKMCIEQHLYPTRKVKVLGKGGTIGVDFLLFDIKKKETYRQEIFAHYNLPSNAFVFGFVGRIQKDKGVNELLEAFKIVSEKNDRSYLLLVGSFDQEQSIDKKNMDWAQKSSKVKFVGHVSDVYRYLSAFDVMVHPTYREGFGMVLQEAGALKVATITTNILGPAEFIKDKINGLLVEPANVEELYNGMIALLNDSEKREEFAQRNYIYTKTFFERNVMIARLIEDRNDLKKRLSNKN